MVEKEDIKEFLDKFTDMYNNLLKIQKKYNLPDLLFINFLAYCIQLKSFKIDNDKTK